MKLWNMESKVVTAKERLGYSLKQYGAIQILLGLGCLIMTFVSIGIDKEVADNLETKSKLTNIFLENHNKTSCYKYPS